MRLFLAIDLPTKVKQSLENQLSEIKKTYADFNWVGVDNYHITIHFFGDAKNIEEIIKRLNDIMYDQESFYLYSRDIDLFINNKIVIYLNFNREKRLEKLAEKIWSNFNVGYHAEQKFVPHLTLARYRIPSKQQYLALKKKMQRFLLDISFPVNKLTLFESILGGKKPVYKKLAEIKLLQT